MNKNQGFVYFEAGHLLSMSMEASQREFYIHYVQAYIIPGSLWEEKKVKPKFQHCKNNLKV